MQMTDRFWAERTRSWAPLVSLALALFLPQALGCGAEAEPADVFGAEAEPANDLQPASEPEDIVAPSAVSTVTSYQELHHRGPVEPRNPATHRPPMLNPGGLDRFRPARPSPGLP